MADTDTRADEREHQADDEHRGEHERPGARQDHAPGGKQGEPAAKKADRRKTTIIVVLTAVGVLIGWLTYRSRSSSSTSGTDTSLSPDTSGLTSGSDGSASYGTGSGYLVGGGDSSGGYYGTYGSGPTDGSTNADAYAGLTSRLDTLNSELGTLTSTLQNPPTSATMPTSPVAKIGSGGNVVTGASQTSQYVLVHDTKTGAWYDVTAKGGGTVHQLTASQLAADKAAGAKITTTTSKTKPTAAQAKTIVNKVLGK